MDRRIDNMEPDNALVEKTVRKELLYKGRIISLYVDDVLGPDGKEAKREYVHHNGGAGVLVVDDEGFAYLVKQYRYAYGEVITEIPAGKLEAGENPIQTAIREVEEETGLVPDNVRPLGLLYPTPGYTDEHLYVYLAEHTHKGEAHPDEDEFLHVVKIPVDELLCLVERGEIRDAKTAYAVLQYARMKGI